MCCFSRFCAPLLLGAQVEFLSKISHPNLLQVQGFCDEGTEQILIFDYMPNGSLSSWLRPPPGGENDKLVVYCEDIDMMYTLQ